MWLCSLGCCLLLLAVGATAANMPLADTTVSERIARHSANNPHAEFSVDAIDDFQRSYAAGSGCYTPPPAEELVSAAGRAPFTFTAGELSAARDGPVSIDWREHGAVGARHTHNP